MQDRKAAALRIGLQVFGGLIALSVLEFWVAAMAEGPIPYPVLFWPLAPITWLALWVSTNSFPFLAVFAVLKAILIAQYFMHVAQIWRGEGGH
jgi:hypothetical protein